MEKADIEKLQKDVEVINIIWNKIQRKSVKMYTRRSANFDRAKIDDPTIGFVLVFKDGYWVKENFNTISDKVVDEKISEGSAIEIFEKALCIEYVHNEFLKRLQNIEKSLLLNFMDVTEIHQLTWSKEKVIEKMKEWKTKAEKISTVNETQTTVYGIFQEAKEDKFPIKEVFHSGDNMQRWILGQMKVHYEEPSINIKA